MTRLWSGCRVCIWALLKTPGRLRRFYAIIWNTFIFVFGLLAIQLVTISLAGFALARMDFRGKDQIFFLFLTQLMVPASILILPNYQTLAHLRWLDTFQGLMAPYIASAFGTFLMRQAFKQVPKELEEAARSDGASWLQVLWHVFLPITRAPLLAFSIVSVTYHWNEFLWPLLITSSVEIRPLTVGTCLINRYIGNRGAVGSTGGRHDNCGHAHSRVDRRRAKAIYQQFHGSGIK